MKLELASLQSVLLLSYPPHPNPPCPNPPYPTHPPAMPHPPSSSLSLPLKVRDFVKNLKAFKSARPLNHLICNAAVYLPADPKPRFTDDGFEMSLGVNHLGECCGSGRDGRGGAGLGGIQMAWDPDGLGSGWLGI